MFCCTGDRRHRHRLKRDLVANAAAFQRGSMVYYVPTGEAVAVLAAHTQSQPPFFTVRMADGREKQTTQDRLAQDLVPSGMTREAMAKLMDQSGSPPTQQVLKAWKLSILRILRSGLVFSPEQVLPLLIIASSDTQHEVVDSAEEAIKLLPQEREELESMALVKRLFSLFLGATANDGMSLRYRIVEQLCRSTLAMTLPAFCVR